MFILGFVGFSSKPSIYGGFGLIVSGGIGCELVLNSGGSFLGLMVFLVYLLSPINEQFYVRKLEFLETPENGEPK
jgi:NADH-ubiquinone oxidoreductase chain 6